MIAVIDICLRYHSWMDGWIGVATALQVFPRGQCLRSDDDDDGEAEGVSPH